MMNLDAYTPTSVAIRDALLGIEIKFIEVNITNIHSGEAFGHHSYLRDKVSPYV